MRCTYLTTLILPALALASQPAPSDTLPQLVDPTPAPAQAASNTLTRPQQTPSTFSTRARASASGRSYSPSDSSSEDASSEPKLEIRQGAPAVGAGEVAQATAATQVSPVTVVYLPTNLPGGSTTWIPVTYSQVFAPVPDQWPSPGVGSIGMGTVTKS